MFAVKFFVTLSFCNFNPKLHKFMFQKGLTFYISTIINVAKLLSCTNLRKLMSQDIQNKTFLHCGKTPRQKNQLNKRSVLTNI